MEYKYKKHRDKYGLVIDWETTGSIFGGDSTENYQGISVGAVVFDTETLDPVDELLLYIKFDDTKYQWSDGAEKVHGITREFLEQNGMSQEDAAIALMTFVTQWFSPTDDIIFMGHNVDFDIAFTKQLLEPFGIMFKLKITKLDTSGCAWFCFGIHKSDDLFNLMGLPERNEHNALEDSLMTLEAAKRIRMLMNTVLSV